MGNPGRHLFIYGTLLPRHVPAGLRDTVGRLVAVGPARVRGCLYDLGAYPGAVIDGETQGWIRGRVVRLPQEAAVIRRLDRYEGFDSGDPSGGVFRRTSCSARLDTGEILTCWIYVYNGDVSEAALIPEGDFEHVRPHQATPKIRGRCPPSTIH